MANISIKLSEQEVNKIILDTIRDKFRINAKTELEITWTDDSGALISTPETSLDKSTSWLDED